VIYHTQKRLLGDLSYTKKRTCLGYFVLHKKELAFVIFHLQKKTCLDDLSYTKRLVWMICHTQKRLAWVIYHTQKRLLGDLSYTKKELAWGILSCTKKNLLL
jgi:hypothetical protein